MENNIYSGQLALINLAIWVILIVKYKKVFSNNVCVSITRTKYTWPILLLALYGVFAYAEADTYHLEEGYEYMYRTHDIIQVEPFYFWLIQTLPNNYILFRMVVWGSASILIYLSARRMNLNPETFGLFLAINFLPQFAQTRGTIGFALLMLALIYVSQSRKKINIIIGVLMIFATYFLHKSIPMFILFIPLAISLPLTKKVIIISLIAFPFFYGMVSYASEYVLGLSYMSEITVEKGFSYLERESTVDEYSVIGNIFNVLQYSSILCLFICLVKFYTNINIKDKTSTLLFKYAYISTYVACLFWGQNMSDFLHTRTLHFAVFPTLFASVYCFQNKERTKFDKITIILLALSAFKEISYHVYKWW